MHYPVVCGSPCRRRAVLRTADRGKLLQSQNTILLRRLAGLPGCLVAWLPGCNGLRRRRFFWQLVFTDKALRGYDGFIFQFGICCRGPENCALEAHHEV